VKLTDEGLMMPDPNSRNYLRIVLILFAALVVITMAIATYRYSTLQPEADVETARP
jgi:hypothetical protein